MKQIRTGLALAVKEHLAEGSPISNLEALTIFGVPWLTQIISDLRREGWVIKSRSIPYVVALARVNKVAKLVPPANLPTREIRLTEYWMSK
jgi:hypothetical protein